MPTSKTEIYVHLIWTTKNRQPLVTADIERRMHRCVVAEAQRQGCITLAIGGLPDHVHLLVRIPAVLALATLAKQVKGVSSRLAGELLGPDREFRWSEGYGAFSIGRNQVSRVAAYIKGQKEHHSEATTWSDWEECGGCHTARREAPA